MTNKQSKNQRYGALTVKYKVGSREGEVVEWFKKNTTNQSDIVRKFIYHCYGYKAIEPNIDSQKTREHLLKSLRYLAAITAEVEATLKYLPLSEPENLARKRGLVYFDKEKKSNSIVNQKSFSESFKL